MNCTKKCWGAFWKQEKTFLVLVASVSTIFRIAPALGSFVFFPLIFFYMQMVIPDNCSAHETSERLCHGVSLCNSKSLAHTMNIVSMNANFQGKDSHEFAMKRNGT